MPRVAYLVQAARCPAVEATTDGLLVALGRGNAAGPARPEILAQMRAAAVFTRRRIAAWDIWIVSKERCQEPFPEKVSGTLLGKGS
jgi:hypothetical protein